MPDVELRGGDAIDALVRRIRTHADKKAIQKDLYSGLNRVSKPVREDMKASTGEPENLPTEGGLQALAMRKQSVVANVRGGRNAGLRILVRGKKGFDLGSIHRTGRLRRPVFGGRFVTQTEGVQPHWMDKTFEEQRPVVAREMVRVLQDIARRVEG
ncbi:hypothetical protein GCM10011584_09340 [Nocardioides phosphati]|uniref:HK97 gp10 family phage protein n=1 Tax=Nocardioides phosphati TaxID=1867775 RepID=A0ABQ2N6R8_9ACTN|nr:hypothetical protein [Nocardioides phosphati]GGO86610.1 hypothetical protein GCM10011584_09340 [Nocardioides phosphati]